MQTGSNGVTLRRIAGGWEFSSELALENFIWDNLEAVLRLIPLKRQYMIKGEICDILAVTPQRQLTVIELKNAEDRYVVQQLTRYYESLIEEKPFAQEIDYDQGVRLLAIAPTFHRHNYVDRKYNRLPIEFIRASIVQDSDDFSLKLESLDSQATQRIAIPFQEIKPGSELKDEPDIPEQLVRWLGSCPPQQQEGFRKIRSYILGYHERIREFVDKKSIQYGTGKTKLCAEFYFDAKNQIPTLFLWLALPSSRTGSAIGRLRIWTDGQIASYVGHVTQGLGKMKLSEEWREIPREKWPRQSMYTNLTHKSHTPVPAKILSKFLPKIEESADLPELKDLVELSLQKWLDRI